jgi:Kef-type K+ transport system membrane component KefB
MLLAVLGPAAHHDILALLVAFAILLISARAMGELATRLGQPPVVGEILAGVLLGPSVISGVFPAAGSWIVPNGTVAGNLLELVGLLGAMFLLLITGLETDIPLIRRHARTASFVALGGLVLPFALGIAVAQLVPDDLLPSSARRPVFAMFLATALAVSAIPVVAKVLLDLGLIRRTFGQTVLAAGMLDDTVAWILLSIVIGLAGTSSSSPLEIAAAAGSILAFIAIAATVGKWLIDKALAVVQDRWKSPDRVFTFVVASALVFGAFAQALGIEAVLGAFIAGIIFGQSPRLPVDVVRRLHTTTLAVFSPVFFAIAGLKVSVGQLLSPRLGALTLAVLVVAVGGKVVGAYVGGRIAGVDHWTSLGFGAALDARGAVGIIIASIGLEMGILSPDLYSMVVVVAVATSLLAPPMVRFCVARFPSDPDESRRLARESAEQAGFPRPRRVLMPVRGREDVAAVHRVAADIIERVGDRPSVTLLSVTDRDSRAGTERFQSQLSKLFTSRTISRVVVGEDPVGPILEMAGADFDLLVLGAPESTRTAEILFNPVVDAVARLAPCPTLIVTGRELNHVNWPPRTILVPTNGSGAARRAAQLAFSLGADVVVFHVVHQTAHARLGAPEPALDRRMMGAQEIVDDIALLGRAYDVRVEKRIEMAPFIGEAVVETAHDIGADLVMLGTDLRPGSSRLHLGPQVELILQTADCPVLLLNSP